VKDTVEREEMEGIAGIIKGRRSIRKYRPDKVSREKILSLLADASFAPSACNLQAWHFIVVDDRGLIKKLV
jgi:nitroreductase